MKFFKLARQITRSAIWDDGTPFDKAHAWIDLLMYVNWADGERMFNDQLITVKRGSQFTSDQYLANRWHWSRGRVRRYLAILEAANMITVKRTPDGTWVNVVNYSKFQGGRTGNGTGDGTTNGTTNGTQLKKNIEEVKKNKREGEAPRAFSPPAEQDVRAYCTQMNYKMNVKLFMAYYEARDWCLSHGKKMVDWKKAVTAWAIRERSNAGTGVSDDQADREYQRTQELLDERKRAAAEATEYSGNLKREVRKRMLKK